MEIHELRAFLAIQASKSFSKGAQSLNITQPAISRRIQSLEQSLSAKLFDRVGHDIFLTPQGQALVPKARSILEAIDQLHEVIQQEDQVVKGQLTLLLSHHMAIYKMPAVLKTYMALYPEVELRFEFIASELGCDMLLNNQGDIGLFTLPKKASKDLRIETLFQDPIRLVVGKNHPLANESNIKLERLAQFQAILPPKASVTAAPFHAYLQKAKVQLLKVQECSVLESIKMLIGIDAGWGLLPASTLNDQLQEIHLADPMTMHRSLGVAYNTKRTMSKASKAMVELIHKTF